MTCPSSLPPTTVPQPRLHRALVFYCRWKYRDKLFHTFTWTQTQTRTEDDKKLTLISNWRYRLAISRVTSVSMISTGTSLVHWKPGHVMLCASPSWIFPVRYLQKQDALYFQDIPIT